jgi:hypothetical protein
LDHHEGGGYEKKRNHKAPYQRGKGERLRKIEDSQVGQVELGPNGFYFLRVEIIKKG